MINKFLHLLVNPISKSTLEFQNPFLTDIQSGEQFNYTNGVVYLLPKDEIAAKSSKLHLDSDTQFNYRDHYQKDAELFIYFDKKLDKATKHENQRLHEVIYKRIKPNSEYILDVGCGEGWVAKTSVPKNIKVISMDISSINPQKAVEYYPSPNHLGLVADAFNLPIKEKSIDTIIASEIMEHVADPKLFVLSLYKALVPNGKLIITTPYNEKVEYSLCVHCNNPTPRHAHIHSFNEHNISTLIPENSSWFSLKFSNFYLTKLRMHIFLAWMPNWLWKAIDTLANFITKKPSRLLIEITKNL